LNGRVDDIWQSLIKEEGNGSDSEARQLQQRLRTQNQQIMMIPRLAAAFHVEQSEVSAQLLQALRKEIEQLRCFLYLGLDALYSMLSHSIITHGAGRPIQTPKSCSL
jgi:ATP-dependent DNA ligase